MLKINRTLPINFTSSKSDCEQPEKNNTNNDKNRKIIEASLAGLAVLGIAGTIGALKTKSDIFKTLKKHGLEIKNGLIVSSKTGENFTGTLKFNSKAYGLEKSTVSYIDGKTTEFLSYNFRGKEVRGLFFKDGKPLIEVGTITRNKEKQFYPVSEYNEKGHIYKKGDCAVDSDVSVFETIRKSINNK